jgi:hypothetical protein
MTTPANIIPLKAGANEVERIVNPPSDNVMPMRTTATKASTMKDRCPDCGVPLGEKHEDGCDVERCPHCGGQALGCVGFDSNDPRREPWNGRWPGEADCERLGFFIAGDRSFPDINRLFAECRWNADQQRWEHDPPTTGRRGTH